MNSVSARLEVGALSETGYVREENQDRMSGSQVPLGQLYIVADGMGGHKGGALAAEIAVQELQQYISQAPASEPADLVIETAFKKANEAVHKQANGGDPTIAGMGTTAVLLLVSGENAKVAHVGDSRAYLYRNSTLSQLTTDHTVVQRMVEKGVLKPEEAPHHPDANILERAIGTAPTIDLDINNHELLEGDAILLCSDGLHGYVADSQIEALLRNPGTVQETTEKLVRLALERGGQDNVTVQLIRYGARKEAQSVRQTQPVAALPKAETAPSGTSARPKQWPPRAVLVCAIAGLVAVSLASLSFFFNPKSAPEQQVPPAASNAPEKEGATVDRGTPESSKQSADTKNSKGGIENAEANVAKLQKELEEARAAKAKAAQRADELERQLAAEKKSAKEATGKLQKQLQDAVAAKENALTEVKGLRQKLDGKERELKEAKKRTESRTKSNQTTPAQQPETTSSKAPGGTSPGNDINQAPSAQ